MDDSSYFGPHIESDFLVLLSIKSDFMDFFVELYVVRLCDDDTKATLQILQIVVAAVDHDPSIVL